MLTMKTKYALQALVALAAHGAGSMTGNEISKRENVPFKFLELIMLELKKHGFVTSKKGRRGGYELARAPQAISMGAVIRAMEGPLALLPCASATAFKPCEECPEPQTCGISLVMREVRDVTAGVLDRVTLADAVARSVQAARDGSSMYQI